ncbi:hypothetical protein DSCO28_44320 [Desulfosarcina ovata subsp. sediminis]|uniref:Uncharacterized protein n=1 Tax=Desulfosarcina ovata subsp. sediminis TaxID=885957 RepID=A0A5K7ZUG8_9BACT|nr:hypothetical protein DSCO28_44320 [Desulfosarcina ovata subsp. sediminis]
MSSKNVPLYLGITLFRDEPLLFAKRPERALNSLLNENLAKARKAHEEQGQVAYALFDSF